MRISGSPTCRKSYDFIKELEKGVIRNEDPQNVNKINKIPLSPQLLIKICGIQTWALLDTGSQVTAVSENFYERIKDKRDTRNACIQHDGVDRYR